MTSTEEATSKPVCKSNGFVHAALKELMQAPSLLRMCSPPRKLDCLWYVLKHKAMSLSYRTIAAETLLEAT